MKKRISFPAEINEGIRFSRGAGYKQFIMDNKNRDCVITIEILSENPSERMKALFFKHIVPEMRRAFAKNGELYTEKKTAEMVLGMCHSAMEEKHENGKWIQRVKSFDELNSDELSGVITELKDVAAMNLNHFIE